MPPRHPQEHLEVDKSGMVFVAARGDGDGEGCLGTLHLRCTLPLTPSAGHPSRVQRSYLHRLVRSRRIKILG